LLKPAQGAQRYSNGQTIEDKLISLIQTTIAPTTWKDVGGQGTIQYFPLGMALVVNQTPDVQEQIQDLLAALRRLQDQEVAIEVRFISVSEDFFERIGVKIAEPAADLKNLATLRRLRRRVVSARR